MSFKTELSKLGKSMRNQNVQETLRLLKSQQVKMWSWGCRDFRNIENRFLRFTVSGHHHKGHVYISVNGSDLYNVYFTSNRGNLKDSFEDIYFDDLVDRIDERVECIAEYVK